MKRLSVSAIIVIVLLAGWGISGGNSGTVMAGRDSEEATAVKVLVAAEEQNTTQGGGAPEAADHKSPAETVTAKVEMEEGSIALLPLENLTDEMDAFKHVAPVLKYYMEKSGLKVVHGIEIEDYICKERIRSAGMVSKGLAMKLKDTFGVEAALTGSIISFTTDEHPVFGILLRMVDSESGSILWADYASASGDDFTTILGLGRIRSIYSLIPKVVEHLFTSFDKGVLHRVRGPSQKIVVMPFENNSEFKGAGKIAMYMFLVELLKNNQYEPIEYGNTREQIINLRIRTRGEMDYEKIKSLSEPLGAGGLLLGVVDSYSKGTDGSISPKVAITARLIDSNKSRIVWYNSHELSGEDDVIALDWGRIRSVHNVAHNVVVHLLKEMGTIKWN